MGSASCSIRAQSSKDVVNGILPKEMGAVGGVAGAIVDFQMGNPIGGIQHAMEALKDLPQAAKGLQGQSGRERLRPPEPTGRPGWSRRRRRSARGRASRST